MYFISKFFLLFLQRRFVKGEAFIIFCFSWKWADVAKMLLLNFRSLLYIQYIRVYYIAYVLTGKRGKKRRNKSITYIKPFYFSSFFSICCLFYLFFFWFVCLFSFSFLSFWHMKVKDYVVSEHWDLWWFNQLLFPIICHSAVFWPDLNSTLIFASLYNTIHTCEMWRLAIVSQSSFLSASSSSYWIIDFVAVSPVFVAIDSLASIIVRVI